MLWIVLDVLVFALRPALLPTPVTSLLGIFGPLALRPASSFYFSHGTPFSDMQTPTVNNSTL